MRPLFSKRTIGPGLRRVLSLTGPLLGRWVRPEYFSGRLDPAPARVLLLGCGGVVESLWAGQVIAPLRARCGPDSVWAACRQATAALWNGWLGEERVLVLPHLGSDPSEAPSFAALWDDSTALREQAFDVAFDLTGQRYSAALTVLARARSGLGFGGAEWGALYSVPPDTTPTPGHLARRPWAAVAPLLGPPPPGEPRPPRVTFEPSPPRSAVLRAVGVARGTPYAVLVPGTAPPGGAWPAPRYAQLAERLEAETGLVPIALGLRRERRLLEAAVARSPHGKVAAGFSLPEAGRLLEGARLVVGGDSSAVHLAAALDVPVVALYNATDPQLRRPLGRRVRVLATSCPHRPSDAGQDGIPRRACPDETCWAALTPDRALAAARLQLLS